VKRDGARDQFVCYRAVGKTCYGAPLTGTQRDERLRIEKEWVVDRYDPLGAGNVFVQDGKNAYSGLFAVFLNA
jgi:hypothetical protein